MCQLINSVHGFQKRFDQINQFSLADLMLFKQVAETCSFSQAAQSLGITQSSASKRIRKLEQQLNVRLFERSTRQVQLSERGQEFLNHSKQVLHKIDEALLYLEHSENQPVGLLRLGIPESFMLHVDHQFFVRFVEKYPHIKFSFVHFTDGDKLLDSGDVDMFLSYTPVTNRKLTIEPISRFKVRYFASENYVKKHDCLIDPEQLHEHDCLISRNFVLPDATWQWRSPEGDMMRYAVTPKAVFDHLEQAVAWAELDLGVVWCPDYLIEESDKINNLIPLFDDTHSSDFVVNAVYPSRQVISPKVRVFLDEIKNYVSDFHPDFVPVAN